MIGKQKNQIPLLDSALSKRQKRSRSDEISKCERCAAQIIRPAQAAKVILEHFDNPKIDIDLEELLWSLDLPIVPQLESKENSGYCQYCSDLMSKTD